MPAWARETEARLLSGRTAPADRFWVDPARLLTDAGLPADPWQADLLRSGALRMMLCCTRQAGKSTAAAALALKVSLLEPGSLVLLLSPTLRQSGELFKDKVLRLYHALGRPVAAVQETQLTMTLANGSRLVSLPGDEATIRGYSSVALLVIDEAARVAEALYRSVSPMLAVSGGRLVCLSSPFGKQGWFYSEWTGGGPGWERYRVAASECSRIGPEFLAAERRALGDVWYSQEYECAFMDTVTSLFRQEDIEAALANDLEPLDLLGGRARGPV